MSDENGLLTERVLDALKRRPDEPLSASLLARELDLSRGQVFAGVHGLRAKAELKGRIGLVGKGIYVYRSTPVDEPARRGGRMFEHVGALQDGRLLIRDEAGLVYTAEPL